MEFVTPTEAAALLGVNKVTVQLWCREEKLPAIKVGSQWRIPKSALNLEAKEPEPIKDDFINENQAKAIAKSVYDALMANVPVIVQFGGR